MNVGSKGPIAWINSRHAHWWRLYLHCKIEETGSPVIIWIICHQVLRYPAEHGTSSMGKHLLASCHIAMSSEVIESGVTALISSTVNDSALAIVKRQASRGITIVSLQSKIIYDIQLDPYWPKWPTKCPKLGAKNFETSDFHQDMRNCYLMLGHTSAHIPGNAISNLELRRYYKASRDDLVVPSGTTPSNICRIDHALTVDAIKKQLLSQNKVSLALDGWSSTK